jgi:Fe2+ or Zn2+ uptake regulation protein
MTTIYNTLDLLKKDGFVHELPMNKVEGRKFGSNLTPHDHLICNTCGIVVDIEVDVDHSLLLTEKQQRGFDIREICINIYGLCPHCKNMDTKLNIN